MLAVRRFITFIKVNSCQVFSGTVCSSMQDEPAFCGLASIAMVLNALRIDPLRPWKGPWRVFHEQLLDCCVPLPQVKQQGITLPQVQALQTQQVES